MITAWPLSVFLLCFQIAADGPPAELAQANQKSEQETQAAIDRAIQGLDSDSFQGREKATKEIWSFGERAKPALQQVIEKGSLDARTRATSILADIELGITPSTPITVSKLLRSFSSSSQVQRTEILLSLLKTDNAELATKLIDQVDDPMAKRELFERSFTDTPVITKLIESGRFQWWVQKSIECDANRSEHSVISNWLSNENKLKELLDSNKLQQVLETLLAQEPDDASRFVRLKRLLSIAPLSAALQSETNIELLLRLINIPANPGDYQNLLLTAIRSNNRSSGITTERMEEILNCIKGDFGPDFRKEIKLALIETLFSKQNTLNRSNVPILNELFAELKIDEFDRSLEKAFANQTFVISVFDTFNFRSLINWISDLPVDFRNRFVVHFNTAARKHSRNVESMLKEPAALQLYWDFVESLSDEDAKADAKLTLAPLMASETNLQDDQRNELIRLVLSTQTADVDAAVRRLLCTPRYCDRIFDQSEIFRAHLIRCGQFSDFGIKFHLEPVYQNIFWNEKATSVFQEADNSRWLLSEYLPSLSPTIRQIAIGALCNSPRVVPTWGGKPFMASLLALVDDQSDADIRARTVAASLRYARFDNVLDDDPKLPFATLFRDETLPDTARAIFITKITDNQSYLEWLHQSDQVDVFIDAVEYFVKMPGIDLSVLNAKHGYVQLLIEKNRMESWFINLERSESAKTNGLVMLTAKADFLTLEVLETNWDRILLLINAVEEPNQRGKYLAAFLLSQRSLQLHQQKRRIGDLLRQIETQENPVVQDALLRSLPRPEVMREIAASGNERELVELIRALPLEKKSSAISLVVNPVMLKYLSKTEQIDFLVEIISLQPSGSNVYTDPAVAELLIHHRYLDRFFDQARTNLEPDGLAAKLLASPSTVSYFQKENRLKDLVALFEQLEAGSTRDTAIGSLFDTPDLAVAVCSEIGVEKCLSMTDAIHYLFSRSNARANAVIASCEMEKSNDERLSQLLSDIRNCGIVDAPRRQSILQGAVGQQLITAGLLPQVKELFLATRRTRDKRLEKPLDDYYSSVLVLKHLDESGNLDEFRKHTRSIRDLQEVFEFTNRLLDSNEGRQILLSSRGFPILASLVENMEAYGQHIFWMDFCGKPTIVEYVAQSNDGYDMIRYLFNRNDVKSEAQKLVVRLVDGQHLERVVENKMFVTHLASNLSKLNASIRSMLALNLSRSPNAIYKLVQSGQFNALVAIIESEQVDGLRLLRWRSVAGLEGGLVSSLISLGHEDRVDEILSKSAESDWHRAWIDLWVRASRGTLGDDIKNLEAKAKTLQEGQWRWLSWAHRALGNDAQATEAAIKINAHSFQTALAIERGDWPEVASLLNKAPATHAYILPQGDEAMTAEHQGMLLVARLFAAHDGELQSPIDALADLRSKTNDRRIRLRCFDSLLLGEQFESTLKSFDQSTVDRAVRLNYYQGNYSATIAAAGWNPQDPHAFMASIRESTGSDGHAAQLTTRLLSALFHTGKFHDMRLLHDVQIKSLKDNSRVLSDNQILRKYLIQLHRFGLDELFWTTIETIDPMSLLHIGLLTDDSLDPVDQTLRSHLPRLAYQAAGKDEQTTDRDAVIAAYRIAAQTYRLTSIPREQLDAWVAYVTVASETGSPLPGESLAAGIVCLRQGRIDDAKRILLPLEETHWVASLALARDAWQRKDWDQAAVHYDRLYRSSRARIQGLYFSGLAIARSGKVDEGEAAMAKARKAAFHPRTLLQMGVESLELGEAEVGKEFLEKVVRLALPHDPAQREAIGHLKASASSPEEVIKWSQQWQMLQARYYYGYGDQTEMGIQTAPND